MTEQCTDLDHDYDAGNYGMSRPYLFYVEMK